MLTRFILGMMSLYVEMLGVQNVQSERRTKSYYLRNQINAKNADKLIIRKRI